MVACGGRIVMAIVADIYDLSAAEFLLMLSLNRKSGKLSAVNGQRKVMVAFREGSIVYAASTAVRERLGNILVGRGLISEQLLQEALRIQHERGHSTHLGNVLVEMGAITDDEIAQVVGGQFQKVVEELLIWPEGMITFSRMDIPDLGAVHVNPRDILTDMGFDTEQLVLGGMSTLEDSSRDAREVDGAAIGVVQSMMSEMEALSVAITAEATLEILAGAAGVVERGVLLLAAPGSFRGAGGFGVEVEGLSAAVVVRNCLIPRDQDSVFRQVAESKRTYVGTLEYNPCHGLFVDQLGGAKPGTVVVAPLVIDGRTVALFYGDNAPGNAPLVDPQRLTALLDHVGTGLTT